MTQLGTENSSEGTWKSSQSTEGIQKAHCKQENCKAFSWKTRAIPSTSTPHFSSKPYGIFTDVDLRMGAKSCITSGFPALASGVCIISGHGALPAGPALHRLEAPSTGKSKGKQLHPSVPPSWVSAEHPSLCTRGDPLDVTHPAFSLFSTQTPKWKQMFPLRGNIFTSKSSKGVIWNVSHFPALEGGDLQRSALCCGSV